MTHDSESDIDTTTCDVFYTLVMGHVHSPSCPLPLTSSLDNCLVKHPGTSIVPVPQRTSLEGK